MTVRSAGALSMCCYRLACERKSPTAQGRGEAKVATSNNAHSVAHRRFTSDILLLLRGA